MTEENTKKPDDSKQEPNLTLYKDIVDRAHDEILWVRRAYLYLGGLIVILISVGGLLSYRSTHDFKNELRADVQVTQKRLEEDLQSFGRRLEQKVNERIEEQFGRDDIRSLVEVAAQKRIDAISDDIIKEKIAQRIDPLEKQFKDGLSIFEMNLKQLEGGLTKQIDEVEVKRARLGATIVEANQLLALLNTQSEFIITVLDATHDDRNAFDKLKDWSEDKNNPFSSKAAQAWNTIYESHNQPMYSSNFKGLWKKDFDASKLFLPELKEQYKKVVVRLKPAMIEYIWKRDDIPEVDRLDFMIEIMKHDSSLTAVEYAGRYFTSGTNLKIKPCAVEYLAEWWGEHRHEFIDK